MIPDEAMAVLRECRDRIDEIDLEILKLINARMSVVERIGEVKRNLDLPIYEPKREDEVFRNVTQNNRGPLPSEAVRRVFERIIDEARTVQKIRMIEREAPGAGGKEE